MLWGSVKSTKQDTEQHKFLLWWSARFLHLTFNTRTRIKRIRKKSVRPYTSGYNSLYFIVFEVNPNSRIKKNILGVGPATRIKKFFFGGVGPATRIKARIKTFFFRRSWSRKSGVGTPHPFFVQADTYLAQTPIKVVLRRKRRWRAFQKNKN